MELARDRLKTPKPPRVGPLVAVALELAMLGTFVAEHSVVGLLLAAGYAYFSATWAAFAGAFDEDR